MAVNIHRYWHAVRRRLLRYKHNRRTLRMAKQVADHEPTPKTQPVVFFNASTRLSGMSLNAAYSLLSSWGLRLEGTPVHHFVCACGLPRCIHGTKREDPQQAPPCKECIHQSKVFYEGADVTWFGFESDEDLQNHLNSLTVPEMMEFEREGIPLGFLALPSLRWMLRRYHLQDDEDTRFFFRQYILGTWSVAKSFSRMIDKIKPMAVVVFNGMVYPEAVARWVARREGIRVITHEVNLLPFTAYFSDKEATFRTIDLDQEFDLNDAQSARLDTYLEQRFQGKFNMAGVNFWKEMRPLGDDLEVAIQRHQQVVPVFTNVIFDTTQDHANTVFKHMFDWLDHVLNAIKRHPETLFVIRAHPDESRPGKFSLESVSDWVKENQVDQFENVKFIPPSEYISSYALIQRAKFTLVYSSTIGLEAVLMGAPVMCAGNARYNQIPTAFYESTPESYMQRMEEFLTAEMVKLPSEYLRNARRFLYSELYQYALSFSDFLEIDTIWQGYVCLKQISWQAFLPDKSKTMRVVYDGIIHQKPFKIE